MLTVITCTGLNWPTQLAQLHKHHSKHFSCCCFAYLHQVEWVSLLYYYVFFSTLMISVLWLLVAIISSGRKMQNAKKKRKIIVLKVFISQGQVKHFFYLYNTLQPHFPSFSSLSWGQPSSVLFIFILNASCGPLCVIYAHFIHVCLWIHLYIYKTLHFYSSSGRRKWFSPLWLSHLRLQMH